MKHAQHIRPYLLPSLVVSLAIGTVIAWWTIIQDFQYFIHLHGDTFSAAFRLRDTYIAHPITTPCLWGSFAFLGLLITNGYWLLKRTYTEKRARRMNKYLGGALAFGFVNSSYTFYKYFADVAGSDHFGCPSTRIDNPFLTPCFLGTMFFLLATIFSSLYLRTLGDMSVKKKTNKVS